MSNQQANNAGSSRSTNRVVGWCLAGVVGMFAFGFAMVPLYDVFCEITGINGKTGGRYESTEVAEADMTRTRGAGYDANVMSLEDGVASYINDFLATDDPYR